MIKLDVQVKRFITAGAVAFGIGVLAMGTGASAASKPITINQIKNTSVGAAGTVKNANTKKVTIKIGGKKYTGKTNKKGKFYIKIKTRPSVGKKVTVKCNNKKYTSVVAKDNQFVVTKVSKEIKQGYFYITKKNGDLKQYGDGGGGGITSQYDSIKGSSNYKNICYTIDGKKGTKWASFDKKAKTFAIKNTFQKWCVKDKHVDYTKMDRKRRKVSIYICSGKNNKKKLYKIATMTVGKDKHDEVIQRKAIDYKWIIQTYTKEVNSGKWGEWKGVTAYQCQNSLKPCFGKTIPKSEEFLTNNIGDRAALDYLEKTTRSSVVGYNDNASPQMYEQTERSYLYDKENGILGTGKTNKDMSHYMLVYKGLIYYTEFSKKEEGKGQIFTYYYANLFAPEKKQ